VQDLNRLDNSLHHSVTLDKEKCKGCTTCLKRCPTEAIRIHNGKARIIEELCIDCGECIKVCPYHAKGALTDTFDKLENFKYNIAIPAPTLYGQFLNIHDVDYVLTGLLKIGFDDIFETAKAADAVTEYTKKLLLSGRLKKPVINSACPAVVRLIAVRFPSLIPNLLPVVAPFEAAAIIAREEAVKKTGLSPSDIGIFFISPCAAKATTIPNPLGLHNSPIDGILSIKSIYLKLSSAISKLESTETISTSTLEGINWARTGGEIKALGDVGRCLSIDGINNIIPLFEVIEDNEALDIDFIEALSCEGGCVGGPLTVENGYVAKMRIVELGKSQKNKSLKNTESALIEEERLNWTKPVTYRDIHNLDSDFESALIKLQKIDEIYDKLPHTDCGSCGSPTCKCFAEDIVRGTADEMDCIHKLKEQIHSLMSK